MKPRKWSAERHARNRARTHCIYGHRYTSETVYVHHGRHGPTTGSLIRLGSMGCYENTHLGILELCRHLKFKRRCRNASS